MFMERLQISGFGFKRNSDQSFQVDVLQKKKKEILRYVVHWVHQKSQSAFLAS